MRRTWPFYRSGYARRLLTGVQSARHGDTLGEDVAGPGDVHGEDETGTWSLLVCMVSARSGRADPLPEQSQVLDGQEGFSRQPAVIAPISCQGVETVPRRSRVAATA